MLVDTSFILPLFGIDTGYKEILKKDIVISPLSLIEAKFITLRMLKKTGNRRFLDRYVEGLAVIRLRYKLTELTNPGIEMLADELIDKLNDYFDRTLVATAMYYGYEFVTLDREIISLRDKIENVEIVHPDDIK